MFIEIFNELLDENNLNRKQFAEQSGIPYTTVIGWTTLKRLPDYTALIKIADFFNCSTDLLTGRQEDYGKFYHSFDFSDNEIKIIKTFRKLSNENKDLAKKLIIQLADKDN